MLPTSGIMLIFIFAFYGLLFAYLIFAYVMQAISLQTIAKRRGIPYPWLAWIPYAVNWSFGAIARDHDKRNGINRHWDKILLITSIVTSVLTTLLYSAMVVLMFVMSFNMSAGYVNEEDALLLVLVMYLFLIPIILLASVHNTLLTICIFKLFESTVPNKTLTYFLIYLLVPFAAPFCLFACRNKGYEVMPEDNLIVEQINAE